MKDLSPSYRSEDGHVLIELELRSLLQFFNTFDPAPFYEKDIDADAEEYIVDAAREIHIRRPLKLILYLPTEEVAREDAESLGRAINNYFAYRGMAARRELRLAFQQGRWTLAIGLTFMVACVALRAVLSALVLHSVFAELVKESLLISGWVAMWRPFQIFLYDWWPIRRKIRVMEKLSRMGVEIRPRAPASTPTLR